MEKEQNNCCWVLAGPTASGKTALSLRLAQRHRLEIVCMDSMQIYRGMDIGTAKPTAEERALVPHHLVDVADPREPFSVARYQELAEQAAREIFARGNRPLFVGGTGFYLRALRHPMAMGAVTGDEELRGSLQAIADGPDGRETLHRMLETEDPESAARLHVNDVRRVIRALEVTRLTGIPFSHQEQPEGEAPFRYRVAMLDIDREVLYRRIEQRVDEMLRLGLVEELRGLLAAGVPENAQALKAIGYKELLPFLRGEIPLERAVYEIKLNTRHYAKRQLTWMRAEEDVFHADGLRPDCYEKIEAWFLESPCSTGISSIL